MQFIFKGVPGESHDSLNMYGVEFPLGVPVNIDGEKAASKLANHPHFYSVTKPVVTEETQAQEPLAEPVKRGPGRPKKG